MFQCSHLRCDIQSTFSSLYFLLCVCMIKGTGGDENCVRAFECSNKGVYIV